MKNRLKRTALLVSLLAGLLFFVGWVVGAGILGDGHTASKWLDTFSRFVLPPTYCKGRSPTRTILSARSCPAGSVAVGWLSASMALCPGTAREFIGASPQA